MHSLVGIIVYSTDEESALKQAKEIMKEHEEQNYFDCYQTFDEEDHGFGDLPTVMKAESTEGRIFINCLMGYTMQQFFEGLSVVRKVLSSKTDWEIWESRHDPEMIRFRFNMLGSYGGSTINLYDNDGEGIQERGHLNNVLDKWECLPESHAEYESLTIYVVPVDAHS